MSLPIPLAVRLKTARADRDVTRDLRDLVFRDIAPGGFASCQISLDRPLTVQPDEIAYYGKVYVYDARTGAVVWEGRLEDPGRGAGPDGQVWRLAAVGPSAHVLDRTVPLVYVDRSQMPWTRVDNVTPGATAQTTKDPSDASGVRQAIVMQYPSGMTVPAGARVVMRYPLLQYAAQKLARLDYQWSAGLTDGNFVLRALARTDGSLASGDTARSDTANTAGGGASPRLIVTNWTAGRNTVDLQFLATPPGYTAANDTSWFAAHSIVVMATRFTAAGSEQLTAAPYTANTVLASEVVADLLGRLLTQYDGAGASIATTSWGIEQLAYPDGVTAGRVLDDLMRLEPAYYWAAWESNNAGKYRFAWQPWPTSVRYEADVLDGYSSQGSADGLYDAVRVRYRDPNGEVRTVRRTQAVPELAGAGLTREGYVDLGEEAGSLANANQVGDQWLADHRYAPNGGTLTMSRPVLDLVTGRMVQPWEIRPGNLIRVRGVLPRVDALNATARDGVTVFRIVGKTYRASSASAELELDQYPATVVRALADLRRRSTPTRRR